MVREIESPDAHALSLRRYKRPKELSGYLGVDACACVGDADHQHSILGWGRGYKQLASGRLMHGFCGIAYQIQEYLLNLNLVGENRIV